MVNTSLGRLLIGDDEATLISVLCELLTKHGYDAVGFTSGKEALEDLKSQNFDLLLTDLMMPEMDGIVSRKDGWFWISGGAIRGRDFSRSKNFRCC